jgi:TetR/AcrR family transcriptional regulator, transcriptional repressor for nem operon
LNSKKEDIISKVSILFHSRGYSNTKLSDILKETGIGKGQFYHYFSSKQDLAEAVIDHLITDMEEAIFEKILDQELSPKEKMNNMLDEIYLMQVNTGGKSGCPIGNLAIEISDEEPLFKEKITSFFERWENKVQIELDELKLTGELKSRQESVKLSRALIAMIEGAILRVKNSQDLEVLNDTIDVIKDMYSLIGNGDSKEESPIYLL